MFAPALTGLHFPFARSAVEFENEVKNRLQNVHPDLVTFIKSFKAYYGGDGDGELYTFGSLSGPNKHQRILGVSLNATETIFAPQPGFQAGPGFQMTGGGNWSELRNEMEVMRMPKGGPIEGTMDVIPSLEIVIGKGEAPLTGPAAAIFDNLSRKIESIVLGIKAETARIKAL